MKDKILAVYNALKDLDVQPSPHNVAILYSLYQILKEAYQELTEGAEDADRSE